MATRSVETPSGVIPVGRGLLDSLGELLPGALAGRSCAVITDANAGRLYADRVVGALERAGHDVSLMTVPAGEATKSMDMVGSLCGRMLASGMDRSSFVVALGGGVVGDLAGFVAAVYARGLPVVQVPTTVVSQVDSSVGGKTGVNMPEAKNMIGAFHQPALVVADTATLDSLPDREFNEGFAEIIKHAAIRSAGLLERVEAFRRGDEIDGIIAENIRIKAGIVAEDERETSGVRALLNFGHTVGHAVENAAGYGEYLHGEAISLGLRAAIALSRRRAGLADAEARRLLRALGRFDLPLRLPESLTDEALLEAMRRDKKFHGGSIRFVLCPRIGEAVLSGEVTREDLVDCLAALRRPADDLAQTAP